MIFRKGKGYLLLDAEKIEIKDNTFLFVAPLQKRRWYTASINEIAYSLHFSEPNNFIRFFKSKTGLSPKAFRDTYQIDSSFA